MVITAGVPLNLKRKAPANKQTAGRSAGQMEWGGGGEGEERGWGETFKRQRETPTRTEQRADGCHPPRLGRHNPTAAHLPGSAGRPVELR